MKRIMLGIVGLVVVVFVGYQVLHVSFRYMIQFYTVAYSDVIIQSLKSSELVLERTTQGDPIFISSVTKETYDILRSFDSTNIPSLIVFYDDNKSSDENANIIKELLMTKTVEDLFIIVFPPEYIDEMIIYSGETIVLMTYNKV